MKFFRILAVIVLLGLLGATLIVQGGDGRDDVGVFRPANGTWYYDYDHNGTTDATSGPWAVAGDLPVAGDFDGDGTDDVAVFRSANRTWYFDYGHDGTTDATTTPWAAEGDLPVAGDFDGDGIDDVAVFRPSNRTWYFDYGHDGTTDASVSASVSPTLAVAGDLPVAGDFDGDGVGDVAIFRSHTGVWYFDYGYDGTTDATSGPWAVAGDLPVAGDFDGDGTDDVAVFHSANRTWYFDYGHNGTTDATATPWGVTGDLPIAGDFEPGGAAPSGDALSLVSVTQATDHEADVVISYTYSGSHGPVYVGAWPTQGGVRAADFEFRRAGIAASGSGTVTIHLTYTAASCIATDGIEVFMFAPSGSPDEPFFTRQFSRGLTWGCGEGGVPPPPSRPSGIELAVDRGCGPGGRPYNLGDPLLISFRVEEAGTAVLYDFDPYIGSYGRILTHQLGTVAPGVEYHATGRISAVRGVETLVLRVATASGVVQDACSFSIAGVSPELARVWTNRGCGAEAVFHHRDRATIYYSVDEPVTRVRIYAINPTMGLVELTTTPFTTQSGQLELTVGPQLGDAVLVVAAVTPTDGVITSSCWVLMG